MTDIKPNQYILFTTRVVPAVRSTLKAQDGTRHTAIHEPERWEACNGSGLVLRVAKGMKDVDGVRHRTARVDAGPWLKTITVSIDDAEVIGEQIALDMVPKATATMPSMYDTYGESA